MRAKDILKEIKSSKKYASLSDEIILEEIKEYIKSNPDYELYKDKKILKDVKGLLHDRYGRFQTTKKNKREKALAEGDIVGILKTNRSTKERLNDYDWLYDKIFEITGNPKVIVDLGGGINACSYRFMKVRARYLSYDIDEKDKDFLNRFFKKNKINGEAEVKDISKIGNIKKLPKADVCFMFKIIDPLEKGKGHKLSEEIINALKCKFIVISFAVQTLSGKKMRYAYRGWFEKMLKRNGFRYKKLEGNSEVYYVVGK